MRNIAATKEFVVNHVITDLRDEMFVTAEKLAPGVDEFEVANLAKQKSDMVKPFRVKDSPMQLECKLLQTVPVGEGCGGATVVIGEVLCAHVRSDLIGTDKKGHFRVRCEDINTFAASDLFEVKKKKVLASLQFSLLAQDTMRSTSSMITKQSSGFSITDVQTAFRTAEHSTLADLALEDEQVGPR